MKMRLLALATILLVGTAHAGTQVDTPTPPSLNDLMQLKAPATDGVADLRARMIGTAGRTVGFRAGLANRGRTYKHYLDTRTAALDSMYQFQTLLGPGGVLPPVIVEARDVAAYADDQMRTSTRVYKIVQPERLVSVPPTWRSYLLTGLLGRVTVDLPDDAARPKNAAEMKVWQDAVQKGWHEGEKAADAIFTANLNRLTRDYNGMLRYSILLQQGVITPTQIAESHRSVSGDTLEIKLDDRLRRITQKAELQANPARWAPKSPLRDETQPPAPAPERKP